MGSGTSLYILAGNQNSTDSTVMEPHPTLSPFNTVVLPRPPGMMRNYHSTESGKEDTHTRKDQKIGAQMFGIISQVDILKEKQRKQQNGKDFCGPTNMKQET